MWKENAIVINEEENILHIGDKALQYINLRRSKPAGYPEGKLEDGDVLVYFAKNMEDSCQEIVAFSDKGYWEDCSVMSGGAVLVASVDSGNIKPLRKVGLETDREDILFADTIYERNEILIRRNQENLEFIINGQLLSWKYEDTYSAAAVVKDNGIKFFGCREKGSEGPVLNLIKTGFYPAFCNHAVMDYLLLEDVLDKPIYEAARELKNEGGETSWGFGGKAVKVKCEIIASGGIRYIIYLFEDEAALMEKLSRYAEEYKHLSKGEVRGLVRMGQLNTFRMWGNEEKMAEVCRLLQKSSVTNTTILLTGESGTGKTFLAREIHRNSKRKSEAFIHVNCAAIPYQLIESELFGYEEGAFTGAVKGGKKGFFEMAYGGTLFLDEITEIPISLQGKLLEVLQNKTYYRVGGTKKYEANVRLIAATNRDLKQLVREKRFREDLYYRINVFPVEIPPLRERAGAMHAIVMDILPDICDRLEMEPVLLSKQAYDKILQYPWPGNIRELENVLEKAVILSDGKIILDDDIILAESGGLTAGAVTLQEVREQAEKEAIEKALQMFHGDKNKAAQYLDIGRSNIFEKVKKYRIQTNEVGEYDFR